MSVLENAGWCAKLADSNSWRAAGVNGAGGRPRHVRDDAAQNRPRRPFLVEHWDSLGELVARNSGDTEIA